MMIKAISILGFSVEDYHQSRNDNNDGQVSSFVNEDDYDVANNNSNEIVNIMYWSINVPFGFG